MPFQECVRSASGVGVHQASVVPQEGISSACAHWRALGEHQEGIRGALGGHKGVNISQTLLVPIVIIL